MSKDINIQNNYSIIKNITHINSTTINNNSNSNSFLEDKKNANYFFLCIILVLFIILVISILILVFILKKKKKINIISNNIGLNKIIINNSNNNKKIISHKGGFQKVQNTSKVNDLVQPNNVLNEIKTYNLGEEIHKIVHSSINSSFTSLGAGKRLNKKNVDSNLNTSGSSFGKGDLIFGNKNIILNKETKKENVSDVNTQKLEQELKQQIKKYVIEDNNI